MYKWARMYMHEVMALLQFLCATRSGNWLLYLASLEKLCVYFFAYNRLDYVQNMPEYIARMHAMKTKDPSGWQSFMSGDFTVNTCNSIPFTRLGIDQAMEHLNKSTKGDGGICGITTYASTLLKFCLTAPELACLQAETEDLLSTTNKKTKKHHMISPAKVARQEDNIMRLKATLDKYNIFSTTNV